MTTKEKVIAKSLKIARKRETEIEYLLNTHFCGLIMAQRTEAQAKLEVIQATKDYGNPEFLAYLKECDKNEKKWFRLDAKQRKERTSLISELVRIQFEINDLNQEQFFINLRKPK